MISETSDWFLIFCVIFNCLFPTMQCQNLGIRYWYRFKRQVSGIGYLILNFEVSGVGFRYRLQNWPQVSGIRYPKKDPIPNICLLASIWRIYWERNNLNERFMQVTTSDYDFCKAFKKNVTKWFSLKNYLILLFHTFNILNSS